MYVCYMDNNDKKKPGRPPLNLDVKDASKAYTVSLTPNKRDAIVEQYGSLTEALNSLVNKKK